MESLRAFRVRINKLRVRDDRPCEQCPLVSPCITLQQVGGLDGVVVRMLNYHAIGPGFGSLRGKTGSLSSPSFAIRFNPEGEELVEVHETSLPEKTEEDAQPNEEEQGKGSQAAPMEIPGGDKRSGKDSPMLSKMNRRTGSLEESGEHPWRFITHIKQITKTVEEKIECIKSERLKQSKAEKVTKGSGGSSGGGGTLQRLAHNSSLSDSEERSETSSSVRECSSSPEKSAKKLRKQPTGFEEDSGDDMAGGDDQLTDESTDGAERATTPQITEIDISDSPTPSVSTGHKSYNFWRRPKDVTNISYEFKVHRRRQKQRKREDNETIITKRRRTGIRPYLTYSYHCSDVNYDPDSSAEDGDQPKLVRTNKLRTRDDRPW
ncbi:hypothetical protein AAG570_004612 [Ranatra chinensis]|uniref:Uncharacterized protein n=1 Tax=Ranatra chinensis TaxID=642074 RepID=A0ABD0Y1D3_9HEMI